MVGVPPKITAQWLNGLSPDERIAFLQSGWAAEKDRWAGDHVCYLMWNRLSLVNTLATDSASAFFLDFGENVYAVTAGHVYDGFLVAKAKSGRRFVSQIGNIAFDLEDRFISSGLADGIDIATFRVTREEIRQTGKLTVLASPWPPPPAAVCQAVYILGYPGVNRLWLDRRSISFSPHIVTSRVTRANDTEIVCVLEPEHWVASEGDRPGSLIRLGGLSGGPLLLPIETDGVWKLAPFGVISEGGAWDAKIIATPVRFIRPDGTVVAASA